jgi:hypothetical protein
VARGLRVAGVTSIQRCALGGGVAPGGAPPCGAWTQRHAPGGGVAPGGAPPSGRHAVARGLRAAGGTSIQRCALGGGVAPGGAPPGGAWTQRHAPGGGVAPSSVLQAVGARCDPRWRVPQRLTQGAVAAPAAWPLAAGARCGRGQAAVAGPLAGGVGVVSAS